MIHLLRTKELPLLKLLLQVNKRLNIKEYVKVIIGLLLLLITVRVFHSREIYFIFILILYILFGKKNG